MANLNTIIISGIQTLFPPICEQEQIINYVKNRTLKIDSILRKKESIIDKLTKYKKSLIYEVVTGKKEV